MLTLYTREVPTCQWCVLAKELLDLRGFKYEELMVNVDITRNDYLSLFKDFYKNDETKRATVPLLISNNFVIGGYEDIVKWVETEGNYNYA